VTSSKPRSIANSSAPCPAKNTCLDAVRTVSASLIGFLMCSTPVTAPVSSVLPSMIDASSSCFASVVKTAPLPALKSSESSIVTIAAFTASVASPPRWTIA
jgi:hypothetical protein